jgi:hypothetical protein
MGIPYILYIYIYVFTVSHNNLVYNQIRFVIRDRAFHTQWIGLWMGPQSRSGPLLEKKCLSPAGNRTPVAYGLVAILAELSRFLLRGLQGKESCDATSYARALPSPTLFTKNKRTLLSE